MKVRVITDSGSGLSKQQANALGMDYLPLQVIIDDKTYLDGVDLTTDTLYDLMAKGFMPQTSLPPLGMIEDLFEEYKREGVTDVVLITLSSGLSSTNSAVQASAKWNNVTVHTFDCFSTLSVEGYLAREAARLNKLGYHPEKIVELLKECVEDSQGFLIVDDLDHLVKGGRLTPMAAKLAGMLKIKPILEVSKNTEGKVDVCDKVRTMSKACKKAIDKMVSATKGHPEDYHWMLLNAQDEKLAKELADIIKEEAGIQDIEMSDICSVIAAHTGLKSIGMQYIKKVKEG